MNTTYRVDELLSQGKSLSEAISQAYTESTHPVTSTSWKTLSNGAIVPVQGR